jgi:hypothetical protein
MDPILNLQGDIFEDVYCAVNEAYFARKKELVELKKKHSNMPTSELATSSVSGDIYFCEQRMLNFEKLQDKFKESICFYDPKRCTTNKN